MEPLSRYIYYKIAQGPTRSDPGAGRQAPTYICKMSFLVRVSLYPFISHVFLVSSRPIVLSLYVRLPLFVHASSRGLITHTHKTAQPATTRSKKTQPLLTLCCPKPCCRRQICAPRMLTACSVYLTRFDWVLGRVLGDADIWCWALCSTGCC